MHKDHLGNTRLLFADGDNDGRIDAATEILSIKNYYPFGMLWENGLSTSPKMPYGYNGKELDTDFGFNLHFYGARLYDSPLNRFTGIDRIADEFPWVSTYNYAENRVPNAIDLYGLQELNFHELWQKVRETLGIDGRTLFGGGPTSQEHANSISRAREFVPILNDRLQNVIEVQEALVPGASSFNKLRNEDYLGAATDVAVDVATGKVLSGLGGAFLKRVRLKSARGESLSSKEQGALDDWMSGQKRHGNDVNSDAPSGYYRAEFESGTSYNGVGLLPRMWQSIKNIIKDTGDKLKSHTHTPTKNKRNALIKEDKGIENDGGVDSDRNYNVNNSPGKKLRNN